MEKTKDIFSQYIGSRFLPKVVVLVRSRLLQGTALSKLLCFVTEVSSQRPDLAECLLVDLLRSPTTPESAAIISVSNVARTISRICLRFSSESLNDRVSGFVDAIHKSPNGYTSCLLLHVCGEIGREIDLSHHTKLHPTILESFSSGGPESVKTAAAFALGNITVGCIDKYLPIVEYELENGKDTYLVLTALREIINCHGYQSSLGKKKALDFAPHVTKVLPSLCRHCEDSDEGARNMVAECLGRLALIKPTIILPALAEQVDSESPLSRATAISALRFCVGADAEASRNDAAHMNISQNDSSRTMKTSDSGAHLRSVMQPLMLQYLRLLTDNSVMVVEQTLITLNAIAHHESHLIFHLFQPTPDGKEGKHSPNLWPNLYDHLIKKKDLCRTVDLGPFKQKIDDGLPLRKAALTCMDTMLTTMTELIDVKNFLPHLKNGLDEKEVDVRMLCHQILIKVATEFPSQVASYIEPLLEPLMKTFKKKRKSEIGTETQRTQQLLQSLYRAVEAISRIPEVSGNRALHELMQGIDSNSFTRGFGK